MSPELEIDTSLSLSLAQIQELEAKQQSLMAMKDRAEQQLREAEAKVYISAYLCHTLNHCVVVVIRDWRLRNLLRLLPKPKQVNPNLT